MENPDQPQISETDMLAYTHRAWQDVLLLLEGQQPPEDEDYGPWKLVMNLLRFDLRTSGVEQVERELMNLLERYGERGSSIPCRPVTPDGRLWREVLEERQAEQAREKRWAELAAKVEKQEKWKKTLAWARAIDKREREEMRA